MCGPRWQLQGHLTPGANPLVLSGPPPHTRSQGTVGLSSSLLPALSSLGASQFPNRASWYLASGCQGTAPSTCHGEMNLKLSPKGKKYAADTYGLRLLQSTCGWLSSSHHPTQPLEYLLIYLFICSAASGRGAQWERSHRAISGIPAVGKVLPSPHQLM